MRGCLPLVLTALLASAAWGQVAGRAPTRGGTQPAARPGTPLATRGATLPATRAATQPVLRTFDTPYYTLHTDVTEQEARETDLRLTRMFEEYRQRTAGFAGQVKEKLPFYLFRKEADYHAAGGPEKSAGVYIEARDGKRLMALAGDHVDDYTWSVVQHEGFHQFAAAAIKYDLPIWANEGLAEYFGEGQWTGDGFVTGLISSSRLDHVRQGIRSGFRPFKQLMALTEEEWSKDLKEANYDEAWSMIHFLGHADNGRYQGAFLQFMTAVSKGVPGQQAWEGAFGRDTDAFQLKYAQWWLALPDHPTQLLFLRVLVQTDTSFLARAFILKQSFPDAETFLRKYQPPDFGLNRDLWLPPKLFTGFNDIAPDIGRWSFQGQRLVLQLPDGTTLVGSFAVANGKVARVAVDVAPPPMGRGG